MSYTSSILQIPALWSSPKGLSHHGHPKIQEPPPYSLLADTLAHESSHGQTPPACSAAAEELLWEPREGAGLLSK